MSTKKQYPQERRARISIVLNLAFAAVLFSSPGFATTALHNINGYTSSDDGIVSFSVLVFDDAGRILATGDDSLLADYPGAALLDGESRTVLPGLIDAHAHVLGLGLLQVQLDLAGSVSVEDAVASIDHYAKLNPAARWILGRGWNQVLWPVREFPTAAHIDAIVSDRPVWLRRVDGHAGWANSVALKLAGIDDDTPDPVGGKIIRDDDGQATGVLVDTAMRFVTRRIPETNKNEVRSALLSAMQILNAEGLTSVHDAGIDHMNADVYLSMADDAVMPMRIYAMIAGSGDLLDTIATPIRQYGNDRLEIAAVKLVADGALGSRGAAMMEPYDDDVENHGLPFWTQRELDQQVVKANNMGFQVAIHAIGDMANRMALNALQWAQEGQASPLRNRIEHAQIIALDDIPRFAELGVIASMQATHATSDLNMAEDRIGGERIKGGYAWQRLLDAGVVIANGSDFPVELANPFHGLYAAVTRQKRDGSPPGGWYPEQAMSRGEALHSFTLAAAFAANQEDRLGSLEPGKWADFIVIDRNYFEIASAEIDDIRVLETWVGGEQVFSSENSGETE